MTIKQQKQLISDTKKIEQFKIFKKINELQKDLHNGKIGTTGFYIEIIKMKEELENGVFLEE